MCQQILTKGDAFEEVWDVLVDVEIKEQALRLEPLARIIHDRIFVGSYEACLRVALVTQSGWVCGLLGWLGVGHAAPSVTAAKRGVCWSAWSGRRRQDRRTAG